MATMKDIAREAGVSHGTVSNVLNKTGKVSTEKIKLVEEAAKKLGYIPNSQAQQLRQGSPTTVALIIPSLREDMYLDLYTTLQNILKTHGYEVNVYTTDDICEYELSILKQLSISNILTIISVSSLREYPSEQNPYLELHCPVIFVERQPKVLRPIDFYIAHDHHIISDDLANYIQDNNFTKIAYFSVPSAISSSELYEYIANALSKACFTIERFSSDINLSLTKAFDILLSDTKFDLIITTNMIQANAILNAITLSHYELPPKIITLGSLTRIPNDNFLIYELSYDKIGVQICELIINSHKQNINKKFLKPKGFPFKFSITKFKEHETLSILTLDTPSTNALKKLVPMFEAISGIQLKIVSMPYNDLHQQISLLNEHHHYDLIRMDIAMLDSLEQDTYMPLTNISQSLVDSLPELVHNSYYTPWLQNQTTYTLPFDPSTQIFLYRKELFEDALICRAYYEKYHEKLTVPVTIQEYLRVAEFFTQKYNPYSPTQYGTTMTCGTASTTASDFMPYLLANSLDKNICNSKEALLMSINEYNKMTNFATQQSWWLDSVNQFINGNTATTIIYSNYAPYVINSKRSNVVGKIGAAIVPGGHPLIGGGVIGICKYSKKIEACIQFFNWYYSEDISSLLVKLGGTSPLTVPYTERKNIDMFPWLTTAKENFVLGTRGLGKPKNLSIQQFEFTVGTTIRNVLTNTISTEDAVNLIELDF